MKKPWARWRWALGGWLARLRLWQPGKLMYIGGSDTLPPPLSREREAELLERIGEEDARKELIEKISQLIAANGGEVEKIDETWGKRRLAYPINFKNEGYYVLVQFTAAPEFPRELERNLQINENVMRYLVTRIEE